MNNTDNRSVKEREEDTRLNKILARSALIEQNRYRNRKKDITSQCIIPKSFFRGRNCDDNVFHTLAAYILDYDIINKKCRRCGLECNYAYCIQCQQDLFIL